MNPIFLLRWLPVFIACGFGRLAAQPRNLPLEFQHIQEFQGLSSNIVNSILQDRDGYLWIGTYGGLNRFDGSHFTVIKADRRNPNSLGNNIVHDICQDLEGNLWLSTDDGISRYNSRTGRFLTIRSLGNETLGQCLNILCDRTGRIWFSSLGKGLFRLDPKNNQSSHFHHDLNNSASLSSNYLNKNGLLEDPERDGLWMTTEADGLNYLDISSGRFLNYRNNPENRSIFTKHLTSALALDSTSRLVIADNTDERILVYDLARKTVSNAIALKSQRGRNPFPLATIFVDRSHNLWASSWQYTMFYVPSGKNQAQEFFHDVAEKMSIVSDFFWTGWQQNDGTIWFGTVNGISYTNPGKTFYQVHNLAKLHPALASGRGITAFLEDDNRNWWLASADDELFDYDPTSGQLTVYPLPEQQPEPFRFGLPMLVVGRNKDELYICRTRSVVVFNKRTRKITPFPLPPMVFAHTDYLKTLVRQGDWLWLFGASDAVFRCHLPSGNWNAYSLPFNTGNARQRVRSAGFDRKGHLWADVEAHGFMRFSPENQQFVAYPNQLPRSGFTDHFAFHVDSRNRIWTPVSGYGLVEFDPSRGSSRVWTEQDGLCSNECKAVCSDLYGQIWTASYNKFSIVNPARSSVQNITLVLNESDINYVDYMVSLRNGNIVTTLKNYVVEFMPHRVNRQPLPARVLISTLALPDTTMMVHIGNPSLQLGVNENNFSINYSILNRAQQTYTYYYKLDGYDDHWVKADARTFANYTKMPGGDYTFRVKAVAGKIETGETKLAVHVDTVFYNTRWFRAALLALFLLLGYWLYQYRTRQKDRLHHFQMQMTRLERDKSEIQYQNLINHLNPHFLFNSLTSLNSLIKTKPKEASVFLRKLSIIYRYILQNKDKELVSLQDELTFAQNYIDLQLSRFGDALQIGITIAPDHLNRQIVPVTIQNLLENAIKHNVISDENPLQIRIYTENDALYVMNPLQKKDFVETSHKQGLASLKSLYRYLSRQEVSVIETATHFTVIVPLL